MKKTLCYLAFALGIMFLAGCHTPSLQNPTFAHFHYEGTDARYDIQYNKDSFFLNPIINGCFPDPSICRKDSDYYLVNSTFAYFPAIPTWHSRDLVHWELIGYALDRKEQLTLPDGLRISGGIYAPDIQYNSYNETFYLVTTAVDCGGNFLITTKDPRNGWSDPIPLPLVGGIDPSLFFDTDGKAYIINNDAPSYPAEYDGHRAIWIHEFDLTTLQTKPNAKVIVDKGVVPADKPIWIEGPHMYHIGDTYYLMAAEGGTGDQHSEVIFHSKSPWGPFEACTINPILTQRDCDKTRTNPFTCAGHADLIQTHNGEWWAVFLGVCPYEGDTYCNTGRSTFLLPVSWHNNQPVILNQGEIIPGVAERPMLEKFSVNSTTESQSTTSGNGIYEINFCAQEPDLSWFCLRTPQENWHNTNSRGLTLVTRPVNLCESKQPSMLCRWIRHATFTASTSLNYSPKTQNDIAGIACFQSEQAHYVLGKTLDRNNNPAVVLLRTDKNGSQRVDIKPLTHAQAAETLYLSIKADGSRLQFYFATDAAAPGIPIGETQDARILSTSYAGGFTGAVIGLYTSSSAFHNNTNELTQ